MIGVPTNVTRSGATNENEARRLIESLMMGQSSESPDLPTPLLPSAGATGLEQSDQGSGRLHMRMMWSYGYVFVTSGVFVIVPIILVLILKIKIFIIGLVSSKILLKMISYKNILLSLTYSLKSYFLKLLKD